MNKCIDCTHFVRLGSTPEHLCRSPNLVSLIHGERLTEKCTDVRRDTNNEYASTLCGMSGEWFKPVKENS